jgi:hypothetical protein
MDYSVLQPSLSKLFELLRFRITSEIINLGHLASVIVMVKWDKLGESTTANRNAF